MPFFLIKMLSITVLVITTIANNIGLTEASSHSLVNETVTQNGKEVLRIEQQRYSRKYDTTFNDAMIQWSYLYTATSPVSISLCSYLCMDHPECVSFFYNKNQGANPNCFLNNKALRSDHFKQVVGVDYFELRVRLISNHVNSNTIGNKMKSGCPKYQNFIVHYQFK